MTNHVLELVRGSVQCAICYEVLSVPSVLSCGHSYCLSCIHSWLQRSPECPSCRKTIQIAPVLNIALSQVIDSLFPERNQPAPEFRDFDWSTLVPLHLKAVLDDDDNVTRCVQCNWEVLRQRCVNCGAVYSSEGQYLGSGELNDMDDDEEEEEDYVNESDRVHSDEMSEGSIRDFINDDDESECSDDQADVVIPTRFEHLSNGESSVRNSVVEDSDSESDAHKSQSITQALLSSDDERESENEQRITSVRNKQSRVLFSDDDEREASDSTGETQKKSKRIVNDEDSDDNEKSINEKVTEAPQETLSKKKRKKKKNKRNKSKAKPTVEQENQASLEQPTNENESKKRKKKKKNKNPQNEHVTDTKKRKCSDDESCIPSTSSGKKKQKRR